MKHVNNNNNNNNKDDDGDDNNNEKQTTTINDASHKQNRGVQGHPPQII